MTRKRSADYIDFRRLFFGDFVQICVNLRNLRKVKIF